MKKITVINPSWTLLIFITTLQFLIASSDVGAGNPEDDEYVNLNVNSKWELQCPHVSEVESYKKIVVTWMLNKAVWLKIDNGNATIVNRLITFNRRQLGSSNVYTIVLNDFRYKFYYDEATGDFSLTIQDAYPEDSGLWQCQVNLYKNDGDTEEFTTQARVSVGGGKPWTMPPQVIVTTNERTDSEENSTITVVDLINTKRVNEESVFDEETMKRLNNTAVTSFSVSHITHMVVGVVLLVLVVM